MEMKKHILKPLYWIYKTTPIKSMLINGDGILNMVVLIAVSVWGLMSCSDDSDVLKHKEKKIEISFSGDVKDFFRHAQDIRLTMTMPLQGDLYKGDSIIHDNTYGKELREEDINNLVFYKMWNREEPTLYLSCSVIYIKGNEDAHKTMTMNVKAYNGNSVTTDRSFIFNTVKEKDIPRDDIYYFVNNNTFSLEL